MAVATDKQRDRAADVEHTALTLPIDEIAEYLQTNLGQKITAYIGGLKSEKEVGHWIKRRSAPLEAQLRLRQAYHAGRLLVEAYGVDTAKAWFFGCNGRLDGEAPAYVIRHGKNPDDFGEVVPAAKAFVGTA